MTKPSARPGLAAAIDVGGTKIAAGIVDVGGGQVLERIVVPTPTALADADGAAVLADLVGQLQAHEAWPAVEAFGLASAGPLELPAERVHPINLPRWRGARIGGLVRDVVGDLPLRLVGDGTAMAYGELRYGAARGFEHVLGVVVSTGVGGGLVVDGRCVEGAGGNAGFIGHVVADPQGEPCPCGRRGCVETMASGPSLVRRALAAGWVPSTTTVDARALVASAQAGDPAARHALASGYAALARAIADAAVLLDLEVVVVGGGVGLGAPTLVAELERLIAGDTLGPPPLVRAAELGADAGLVGAAAFAADARVNAIAAPAA